ncbi:MAG: hypothetical protein JRJ43_07015, partial [Deltaproteobacteria bacterium]|nr:hypothetical protein [Deltaproteobacteria bacterium]
MPTFSRIIGNEIDRGLSHKLLNGLGTPERGHEFEPGATDNNKIMSNTERMVDDLWVFSGGDGMLETEFEIGEFCQFLVVTKTLVDIPEPLFYGSPIKLCKRC